MSGWSESSWRVKRPEKPNVRFRLCNVLHSAVDRYWSSGSVKISDRNPLRHPSNGVGGGFDLRLCVRAGPRRGPDPDIGRATHADLDLETATLLMSPIVIRWNAYAN